MVFMLREGYLFFSMLNHFNTSPLLERIFFQKNKFFILKSYRLTSLEVYNQKMIRIVYI